MVPTASFSESRTRSAEKTGNAKAAMTVGTTSLAGTNTQTLATTALIVMKTLVAGTGSMIGEIMTAGGMIVNTKCLAKIEIAGLMTGALVMTRVKTTIVEDVEATTLTEMTAITATTVGNTPTKWKLALLAAPPLVLAANMLITMTTTPTFHALNLAVLNVHLVLKRICMQGAPMMTTVAMTATSKLKKKGPQPFKAGFNQLYVQS